MDRLDRPNGSNWNDRCSFDCYRSYGLDWMDWKNGSYRCYVYGDRMDWMDRLDRSYRSSGKCNQYRCNREYRSYWVYRSYRKHRSTGNRYLCK